MEDILRHVEFGNTRRTDEEVTLGSIIPGKMLSESYARAGQNIPLGNPSGR